MALPDRNNGGNEAAAATDGVAGAAPSTEPAPAHGGRLIAAAQLFPDAPTPWIDLSTGISPFPYPVEPLPPEAFARLPEPEQERALRRVAAEAYGAPDEEHVCLAPGSQMLISLLPVLLGCKHAAILSPGYGEHEAAWSRAGARIERAASVSTLAEAAAPGAVLVLCNPNNPDGRRTGRDALDALSRRCASSGAWLVVDEAYADLDPSPVLAATALPDNERLLVLRSFGKGYGLAGIRLGALLGGPRTVAAMAALMGPWPVSGPALSIGTRALADRDWRARTALRVAAAAERLDRTLGAAGLAVTGGTALFRLAEAGDAEGGWRALASSGILARRFPDRPRWLRFGLPADEATWCRLEQALAGGRGWRG